MRKYFIISTLCLTMGCSLQYPVGRDPAIIYIVKSPEEIKQLAVDFRKAATLDNNIVGLSRQCVVYVPPMSVKTRWIWEHEERHCREGAWHD